MSATPRQYVPPSPAQTALPAPAPAQSFSLKRRRPREQPRVHRPRDTSIVDQAQISAAMDQCFDSPNNVISCWPTTSTNVAQHEWATFVWNSRLPQWAQTELVNIYLFQADSGQQVLNLTNVENPVYQAGVKHVQVDDRWWGSRGDQWNGQNISFPFYFVITRNDRPLDNSAIPQATFTAVQTTFADSIVASMSSSSAAARSSSIAASLSSASAASASASSLSASRASATPGATATSTGSNGNPSTGSVQGANGGTSFPHWAIAVIVVLGFLALVASGILAFYIMRRLRQRREGMLSHRNSMGSSTPMMSNADRGGPQSPVIGSSAFAGGAAGAAAGYSAGAYSARPSSPGDMHDGASMMSRTSDAAPFSGADAAIMANAFRQALRKPDFADRPVEEGESPDDQPQPGAAGPGHSHLINQELAEEGRDIRSVSSSRGVKVETLSDDTTDNTDTATVQDHPH